MRLKARAKINWTLDITGQRADGYHLMDMLMQPVTLSDEITLTPAGEISLTTGGSPLLPADEKHLAWRAAMALKKHSGIPAGQPSMWRSTFPSARVWAAAARMPQAC